MPFVAGPKAFAGITDDNVQMRFLLVGRGSPETVVSAEVGALYSDTDTGTWYYKASGNSATGWTTALPQGAVSGTTGTFTGAVTVASLASTGAVSGTSVTGTSEVVKSTHLAQFNVLSVEGTITCSGATSTASNLIPAGATPVGFASRVTTLITSAAGTSFTLGDGTTADLYGTGLAFTAGTTSASAQYKTPLTPLAPASRTITATCTGGTFTGGVIECVVFYTTTTAPTS